MGKSKGVNKLDNITFKINEIKIDQQNNSHVLLSIQAIAIDLVSFGVGMQIFFLQSVCLIPVFCRIS